MNREHIDELAEQQAERRRNLYHGLRTDKNHFEVSKHPFEIVYDYRQGFDLDKFVERYSSILNKYDYIVGDWGFEQLRLKGFFGMMLRMCNGHRRLVRFRTIYMNIVILAVPIL